MFLHELLKESENLDNVFDLLDKREEEINFDDFDDVSSNKKITSWILKSEPNLNDYKILYDEDKRVKKIIEYDENIKISERYFIYKKSGFDVLEYSDNGTWRRYVFQEFNKLRFCHTSNNEVVKVKYTKQGIVRQITTNIECDSEDLYEQVNYLNQRNFIFNIIL